jgi:hypothetical protein
MAAPQLIWEVVKGHNSFLRKNLNGTSFSAEAGNLYNKHSYKYSGKLRARLAAKCAARLQVMLLLLFSAGGWWPRSSCSGNAVATGAKLQHMAVAAATGASA